MGKTLTGDRKTFDRVGWILLAALTALAVAMRFYRLDSVPVGLHYDEAFNGLDALSLLEKPIKDWPVFFNGNYGREPLFIWISSVAHKLFGPSVWTARFVSALSGVLTIPALAWLGWQLAPSLGVRNRQLFSLWCPAAVLALLWSQVFARYGIRASLFVLLETLMWAAAWRAWQKQPPSIGAWLLTGFLAGLSFYTYLPARLLPFIILTLLVAAFFQDRTRLVKSLPGLMAGVIAALLISAPLGIFFIQNPVAFSTRIGQVATGIEWKQILLNLLDALGLFVLSGDENPLNNLPSRPALDLILAPPFLIGLVLALHKGWKLSRMFLTVGLGTLLLPTVFSDWAPNYQRAIGVLPFVGLLVALGAEGLVRPIRRLSGRNMQNVAVTLIWGLLAVSIAVTNWTYFNQWKSLPVQFFRWTAGYNQLARHISVEDHNRIYISPRDPTHPYPAANPHPSGDYLLMAKGVSPQYHDDRYCIRVALSESARYIALTGGENRYSLKIDSHFPVLTPPQPVVFDPSGTLWATEFKIAKDVTAVFPEMRPYNVEMADGVSFRGYSLSSDEAEAGQPLGVRLFWRVNRTPSLDYTLFFHLLNEDNEGSFERLAVFDRPPGRGSCPMSEWLPEEMVIDQVETVMPATLPPGDLYFSLGFYTPLDGIRMPVSGEDESRILIGPLKRAP